MRKITGRIEKDLTNHWSGDSTVVFRIGWATYRGMILPKRNKLVAKCDNGEYTKMNLSPVLILDLVDYVSENSSIELDEDKDKELKEFFVDNKVPAGWECPDCGEDDMDTLNPLEGEGFILCSCGLLYDVIRHESIAKHIEDPDMAEEVLVGVREARDIEANAPKSTPEYIERKKRESEEAMRRIYGV